MATKTISSGARILKVLEAIAAHQPVGPRTLARVLEDDKSAVHRALMTLAEQGWITPSAASKGRWEISRRIMTVADRAHGGYDLKRRARPVLEKLRDETSESVTLIVSELGRLVIGDVIESREMLRVVPPVGAIVAIQRSAGGRAILSQLKPGRWKDLLGKEPDVPTQRIFAETKKRGYSISEREIDPGATALGAAISDYDGTPYAAISIIGPFDRLSRERFEEAGGLVVEAAKALSRGY
ncbi:MAG TPA: IclR family transcriptional regulator [Sphingobium sp.]|uniref:IclR family transcriptional regulator n=1 Tax=Sphingobium sp. TaxID=1912891 RepID=UPI002ED2AE66